MLPPFDPTQFGGDVAAYFASTESGVSDLTPGTEKRVIWAGKKGKVTPLSVLYLHGFSATSEEIRPVPDKVASALDANLVYTRFTGHGGSGAALADATGDDWLRDTAEALAAANEVGEQVIIIATSTGGTLAAFAALDQTAFRGVKGIIFVSPNFALTPKVAFLLNLPYVELWGPLLFGKQRSFEARNERHQRFWTLSYPTGAVINLNRLLCRFRALDLSNANVPALFLYSENDQVVSPAATARIAKIWGGPAAQEIITVKEGDDAYSHVIAGDILSPGSTETATRIMLDWIAELQLGVVSPRRP